MKGVTFRRQLLLLIFNRVSIPGIATAGGLPSLVLALHTGDVAPGDDQSENECQYPGYNRMLTPRDAETWQIADNVAILLIDVDFPRVPAFAPKETVTFFSVGVNAIGASRILYVGEIMQDNADLEPGITPRLSKIETRIIESPAAEIADDVATIN